MFTTCQREILIGIQKNELVLKKKLQKYLKKLTHLFVDNMWPFGAISWKFDISVQ